MKKFSELYEKFVGTVQRKKMARRMAKLARSPAFQMKKKRSALRMKDPAKLRQLARKKTIQSFRDKFYSGYKEKSFQERAKIDQLIMQKYGKKIDKISKKLEMKLKKSELERIKKARAAQ